MMARRSRRRSWGGDLFSIILLRFFLLPADSLKTSTDMRRDWGVGRHFRHCNGFLTEAVWPQALSSASNVTTFTDLSASHHSRLHVRAEKLRDSHGAQSLGRFCQPGAYLSFPLHPHTRYRAAEIFPEQRTARRIC